MAQPKSQNRVGLILCFTLNSMKSFLKIVFAAILFISLLIPTSVAAEEEEHHYAFFLSCGVYYDTYLYEMDEEEIMEEWEYLELIICQVPNSNG